MSYHTERISDELSEIPQEFSKELNRAEKCVKKEAVERQMVRQSDLNVISFLIFRLDYEWRTGDYDQLRAREISHNRARSHKKAIE